MLKALSKSLITAWNAWFCVVGRPLVLLVAVATLVPALAGCADDTPAGTTNEPLRPGGTSASTPTPSPNAPIPKSMNERWHFHDYWKGTPTITIMENDTTLEPTASPEGATGLSAILTPADGVIVPPETGTLSVTITWEETLPGGAINLTYRPADSNGFHAAGDVANGETLNITVTESMADVPHRPRSLWAFNVTAVPGGTPPLMPARDVRVVVTATIGRPLFIDPPHVNWWQTGDVLPLVAGATGTLTTATGATGNVTVPRAPAVPPTLPPAQPPATPTLPVGPTEAAEPARVPVDAGRIVPEGARSIVVSLNWTSEVPDAKLAVHYRESNLGTSGPLDVTEDGAGHRVFTLLVDNDQTDTTYSNRTTWEFMVVPEPTQAGAPAAFHGEFTLYAWVTKLEPAAALRETVGAE